MFGSNIIGKEDPDKETPYDQTWGYVTENFKKAQERHQTLFGRACDCG
jgi:hypothetical protein